MLTGKKIWGLNSELFKKEKRKCKRCKEIKSLSQFWKNKSNPQGYDVECKYCSKTRQKDEWKRFASQPVRMYQKLQRIALGYRAKKGYSQHKLEISKDEFIKWYSNQDKYCTYCGLSLDEFLKIRKHFGKLTQKTNKFGLDRKEGFFQGQ